MIRYGQGYGAEPQNEWLYHMQQTSDGGIILSGLTNSFGAGDNDILLIKTDANGTIQWAKAYGDTSSQYGFGHCLQQTSDGGYIITGVGGFLLKTDSIGTIQWQKKINFDSSFTGHAVEQTTDGGYIVGGYTGSTTQRACLVKTDDTGKVTWSYYYGGNGGDICWAVRQADDGGYFMSGQTSSFGSETFGDPDAYLVKTDANGISGCNETPAGATSSNSDYATANAPLVVNHGPQTQHPQVSVLTGYSEATLCTATGIYEPEKINRLTLYPNPSNGNFIIESNSGNTGQVQKQLLQVFDITGRLILSQIIQNSRETIDATNLVQGVYDVRLTNNQGVGNKKLVIVKM